MIGDRVNQAAGDVKYRLRDRAGENTASDAMSRTPGKESWRRREFACRLKD
jgi:hypothetical protein